MAIHNTARGRDMCAHIENTLPQVQPAGGGFVKKRTRPSTFFGQAHPNISTVQYPPYNPITMVELSFELCSLAIVTLGAMSNWQTTTHGGFQWNVSSRVWIPSGWNRSTKCLQTRRNLPKKKTSVFFRVFVFLSPTDPFHFFSVVLGNKLTPGVSHRAAMRLCRYGVEMKV